MSEILNFAKASEPVSDEFGFIRTETARDILRTLTLLQSVNGPAVSMISGAPGIGKTETLLHYERENPEIALRISIPKGEGNPFHVSANILNMFNPYKRHDNDMTVRRNTIMRSVGHGRILLVDEAQNLFQRNKASCTKGASFGWLVAASEEGGFDLVFCGDHTLSAIMLDFPHLQSRMRRPVLIHAAAAGDVAALAADQGFTDKVGVDLLGAIAKLSGGLRNVDNVLRMAAIFAGKDRIAAGHVQAAIKDLKLKPTGGK